MASGRSSASLAQSQCRPWKRANRRSSAAARSGTCSNNGRASPAAPANARSRSSAASGSMHGASSWITMPRANSCSITPPRARSSAIPPACASSAASPIKVLLPIPGAPSTTTTPPTPAAAARSAPPSWSSSASRSNRGVPRSRSARRRPATVGVCMSRSRARVACAERTPGARRPIAAGGRQPRENLRRLHVAKRGRTAIASPVMEAPHHAPRGGDDGIRTAPRSTRHSGT